MLQTFKEIDFVDNCFKKLHNPISYIVEKQHNVCLSPVESCKTNIKSFSENTRHWQRNCKKNFAQKLFP